LYLHFVSLADAVELQLVSVGCLVGSLWCCFYQSVCLRSCPERKEETTATPTATRGLQKEILYGELVRSRDALKPPEEGAIATELQVLVTSIMVRTMEHHHHPQDVTIICGPMEVVMVEEVLTVVEDTQVDEVTQEENLSSPQLKIGRPSTTLVRT
jgi:hypothetical protein